MRGILCRRRGWFWSGDCGAAVGSTQRPGNPGPFVFQDVPNRVGRHRLCHGPGTAFPGKSTKSPPRIFQNCAAVLQGRPMHARRKARAAMGIRPRSQPQTVWIGDGTFHFGTFWVELLPATLGRTDIAGGWSHRGAYTVQTARSNKKPLGFQGVYCARNRTCRRCEVNGSSDPLVVDRQGDALGSPETPPEIVRCPRSQRC
jgi:hypothetical protein